MHPRILGRRLGLAATAAALGATSILGGAPDASSAAQADSTPVPVVTPDGYLMS